MKTTQNTYTNFIFCGRNWRGHPWKLACCIIQCIEIIFHCWL